MRIFALTATLAALLVGLPTAAQATPAEDLKEFREHFMKRFPGIPLEEYKNGVYAINADARSSWEAIEEFPPYEDALAKGEKLFKTPFANGKTYASCFSNGGKGIRQNYPYFDKASGQIKTLEGEINECRVKNGEKPLGWKKGDIAAISAYMASTSNGKKLNVVIPNDKRALAAYERGKRHFYAKRGQLNLSCANCHYDNAGNRVRADTLSPALGHPTHFPVWRLKWDGLGTMHRRFGGCNKQVRAKPFKAQSDEYKALEYFETYMSNGITVNAPSTRK
ncbi:sulfur oxidation c-type cytochrome SoxA [Sedimenticola sp.]|uniref:sulfur oxidation c-type cytochrome SoxA n=1 Tax=Sedimenticola sp. TaxID=1940285 RepID=UPI003D124964